MSSSEQVYVKKNHCLSGALWHKEHQESLRQASSDLSLGAQPVERTLLLVFIHMV